MAARLEDDLGRIAGRRRRHVSRASHFHWMNEVLVQMIDELDHPPLECSRYRDVIEHRQVLDELAQSHAAGVWADRNAELGRHQDDGKVLVDTTQPTAIDLAEADRVGLKELFE